MDAEALFHTDLTQEFVRYPDLAKRPVFIVGGSSGLGAYFSAAFAAQGAPLGFVSNEPEAGQALCDRIENAVGQRPFFEAVDVRDLDQLSASIRRFSESCGGISVLINNAARDDRHTLQDVNDEMWRYFMDINVRPYLFAIKEVEAEMARKGYGSVINMSSNANRMGATGFPVYVTSKSAVVGMSKALSRELGPKGIRVNTLTPGWVITERQRELWYNPQNHKDCLEAQSIKRMMNGVDIANAALFLASTASSMICGQEIVIDGGRS